MAEIEKDQHNAMHYNQIGWLITSFFLIFLGTMLPEMIKWINKPSSIDPTVAILIIFLIMFFGFIVARLFLRSQMRKMKIWKKSNEFFRNSSIWIYVIFVLFIETILGTVLYKIVLIDLTSLILLIVILIKVILFILLETKNLK